jgi:hypothetical protein
VASEARLHVAMDGRSAHIGRLNLSRRLLVVGPGIVAACVGCAATLLLNAALGQPADPVVTIPPEELAKGLSAHQSVTWAPLDQLIVSDDVAIAVVEPLRRGAIQIIPPGEQPEFGLAVGEVYQGAWPLTPVTVSVIETLKGDLPGIVTVWENRGTVGTIEVDSNDPFLSPGARGLLLMSVHTERVRPIIFAPIDEDGYMPRLEMTLDQFRALLEERS